MSRSLRPCPTCGVDALPVKRLTLQHHLRFPLALQLPDTAYWYCAEQACEQAYFSMAVSFSRQALQSAAAIEAGMRCFCFGITEDIFYAAMQRDQAEFFAQLDSMAAESTCHCSIKNPSGRGCLRSFRRSAKLYHASSLTKPVM